MLPHWIKNSTHVFFAVQRKWQEGCPSKSFFLFFAIIMLVIFVQSLKNKGCIRLRPIFGLFELMYCKIFYKPYHNKLHFSWRSTFVLKVKYLPKHWLAYNKNTFKLAK